MQMLERIIMATKSQHLFSIFVERNKEFVWKRAMLLSKGDSQLAQKHAVQIFLRVWEQVLDGSYRSLAHASMQYIKEELVASKIGTIQ